MGKIEHDLVQRANDNIEDIRIRGLIWRSVPYPWQLFLWRWGDVFGPLAIPDLARDRVRALMQGRLAADGRERP